MNRLISLRAVDGRSIAGGLTAVSLAASLLASALLLVLALAGGEAIQGLSDRLAQDGSARVDVAAIRRTAGLMAAGFGLLALPLFRFRAQVAGWLAGLLSDIATEARSEAARVGNRFAETNPIHGYSLAAIFGGALAIRVAHLWVPMRYDEAYTFHSYASQSFFRILVDYWPNNHILHSLLAHAFILVAGDAPWAVRATALAAGVLIVPATYLLFSRYASSEAGLIAAALVAISPPLIAYSVNARGYTLVTLFFIALVGVTLELTQRSDRSLWALFVLLCVAGLFTVLTMALGIAFCVVSLAVSRLFRSTADQTRTLFVRQLVIALGCVGILTGLLYSPAILVSGWDTIANNRFIEAVPWGEMPQRWRGNLEFIWNAWHRGWPIWMSAVVWCSVLVGLAVRPRRPWPRSAYFLVGLIGCLAVVLAKRIVPVNRVWLFLAPTYLGVAAIGVSFLLRQMWRSQMPKAVAPAVALAVCLVGGMGVATSHSVDGSVETGGAPDAEAIGELLSSNLQPGDGLVVSSLYWHSVWYYVDRSVGSSFRFEPENASRRLFVVIDRFERRSLQQLLHDRGVDGHDFVSRGKLWQSTAAEVFEFHRKTDPASGHAFYSNDEQAP